jgi:hypothetical protein
MRPFFVIVILLMMSAALAGRSVDSCVTLESSGQVDLLVQELNSQKMPYRIDQTNVCVDEPNGGAFFNVVSKLFDDPSKRRHLNSPHAPSGAVANSFTFQDATKQAALEASLRHRGIWFQKDESGTMWYEITNEAVVRETVFVISEGGDSRQRSNSTVETDARKSSARGSP